MLRAVLDTNILVSGLLTPSGLPARVLYALRERLFTCFYTHAIIYEYVGVLSRPKFGFVMEETESLINDIRNAGSFLITNPSARPMPDESDRVFYDAAKAAGAYLITGNAKHYPIEPFILSPAEFIKEIMDH